MIEEFRVHRLYYLLVTFSVLLLVLLGSSLWEMITTGALLFLAIAIVAILWFISALGTRVHLSPTEMTIQMPLRFPLLPPLCDQLQSAQLHATGVMNRRTTCTIDYRQLYSIDESGRFLTVLTILYHPSEPDGLLDLTQIATVTLPLMGNQQTLRQRLEAALSQ